MRDEKWAMDLLNVISQKLTKSTNEVEQTVLRSQATLLAEMLGVPEPFINLGLGDWGKRIAKLEIFCKQINTNTAIHDEMVHRIEKLESSFNGLNSYAQSLAQRMTQISTTNTTNNDVNRQMYYKQLSMLRTRLERLEIYINKLEREGVKAQKRGRPNKDKDKNRDKKRNQTVGVGNAAVNLP